jgi:hypothetical protein
MPCVTTSTLACAASPSEPGWRYRPRPDEQQGPGSHFLDAADVPDPGSSWREPRDDRVEVRASVEQPAASAGGGMLRARGAGTLARRELCADLLQNEDTLEQQGPRGTKRTGTVELTEPWLAPAGTSRDSASAVFKRLLAELLESRSYSELHVGVSRQLLPACSLAEASASS